jgi:hypothetical protein
MSGLGHLDWGIERLQACSQLRYDLRQAWNWLARGDASNQLLFEGRRVTNSGEDERCHVGSGDKRVLVHGYDLSLLTTSNTLPVVEWQVFSRVPSCYKRMPCRKRSPQNMIRGNLTVALPLFTKSSRSLALLHQILLNGFCATGDQEVLVALSAGAIGVGIGLRITSSCHCSSRVSSR